MTPTKETEKIEFSSIRFRIPGFEQQADRKQKHVEIRVAVADKLFPEELILPSKSSTRLRGEGSNNWLLDTTQYYFFLNYKEIYITTVLSKNCISLKIPHRVL